jgi:hypothetical protein
MQNAQMLVPATELAVVTTFVPAIKTGSLVTKPPVTVLTVPAHTTSLGLMFQLALMLHTDMLSAPAVVFAIAKLVSVIASMDTLEQRASVPPALTIALATVHVSSWLMSSRGPIMESLCI